MLISEFGEKKTHPITIVPTSNVRPARAITPNIFHRLRFVLMPGPC
jgi:hypothetical protein